MSGPLDSISSILQGAVLQSQLQSAQREAEIANERRLRAGRAAAKAARGRLTAVDPVEGRIIEENQPHPLPSGQPLQPRKNSSAEDGVDPGRIDVLV